MAEKAIESIELFFQEQPSDKVYNVALVEEDGSFTVRVAWGRRGAKLSTGTKAVAVSRAEAEKAYAKVVKQKTKKGYEVASENNQPAAVAPEIGEGSGSKAGVNRRPRLEQQAQLLNSTSEDALESLLESDHIVAQQKLDGMRVLVHVRQDGVVVTNRSGEISSMGASISTWFDSQPLGSIFDGELLASAVWLFDVLEIGGEDLRQLTYADRLERLAALEVASPIERVPTAHSNDEKRRLHETLVAQGAEGIVFKDRRAVYQPGRPASGGDQLKLKFIKSADVVIIANAGNAYQMAVFDGVQKREIGKVFAGTTNESRAEIDRRLVAGETPTAEVRYLYATDDQILFQPVFVRIRDDKEPAECKIEQLVGTDRSGLREI